MRNKCILFAALLMLSGTISAKVVLPPMFSDNMVLQQQADAPIWGEAKPMKTVKVTTSWLTKRVNGNFLSAPPKRVDPMNLR